MEDFAEVLGAYSTKGDIPAGVPAKEDAGDVTRLAAGPREGNDVSENKEASFKERAVHEEARDSSEDDGGEKMLTQVDFFPALLSQRIDIPDPYTSPGAGVPADTQGTASVTVDMSTDTQTALRATADVSTDTQVTASVDADAGRGVPIRSMGRAGETKDAAPDVRGILAEAPSAMPVVRKETSMPYRGAERAVEKTGYLPEDTITGSAMAPAACGLGGEDSQTPVPDLKADDSDEAAGISVDPKDVVSKKDVDSNDVLAGNVYHKDQSLKTGQVRIDGKIPQTPGETSSPLQTHGAALLSKDNAPRGDAGADGANRDADGFKAAASPADTQLPLTDAMENAVSGRAFISFEKAVPPSHADGITGSSQEGLPRVIYEGVDRGVSLSVLRNGKEVSVSLHPENLGRLHIRVIGEESGVAAKIVVENAEVKQILDADAVRLREIFAGQGLKLGGYSVEIGSFGPSLEGRENGGGLSAFGSSGGDAWAYPGAGNGYAGKARDSDPKAQGLPHTDYPGNAGGKRYSGIDLFI
ncbi:MAG: flagellar hook-length control protein FliK [Deltaproteobacteria bacterium]|nr:flagellar hook-length control protein FliK [Deltaproteobacteria bacterium]